MLSVPNWSRVYTGKVHDMYAPIHAVAHSGNEIIMLVTSDRMSVLDRVLPTMIPGKGEVVNAISEWWFKALKDVTPNHFLSDNVPPAVRGRAMVVQRLRMFPIECTVAGYVTERVVSEHGTSEALAELNLPADLDVGDKLDEPVFLPSIKAEVGADDEPISFARMCEIVGEEAAERLRELSLDLFKVANSIAASKGLIIADSKLEFGASSDYGDEEFVLADQAFTPDSSTYWIADELKTGQPRAFGKDYVREAVEDAVRAWIRGEGRAPELSTEIVNEMSFRYRHVKSALFR